MKRRLDLNLAPVLALLAAGPPCGGIALAAPPAYVLVPGGTYVLGDDQGRYDERPAVRVQVSPFELAVTETSNEEYERFVRASGYRPQGPWRWGYPAGGQRLPVRYVTWHDAAAYARWAGCRLPTEAEWTAASQGVPPATSPGEGQPLASGPVAVDAGPPPGPLRLHHLEDNVSEWVADWYYRFQFQDYAAGKTPVDPRGPRDGAPPAAHFVATGSSAGNERATLKVARGPSFAGLYRDHLRLSRRRAHNPHRFHDDVGFRCARDLGAGAPR